MNETQPKQELTDGQAAIKNFELYQTLAINGQLPDSKRYEKEFFEHYGSIVKSRKAPLYLMFCAFVGALDLVDAVAPVEEA